MKKGTSEGTGRNPKGASPLSHTRRTSICGCPLPWLCTQIFSTLDGIATLLPYCSWHASTFLTPVPKDWAPSSRSTAAHHGAATPIDKTARLRRRRRAARKHPLAHVH